jgi:hypothetical protein
MTYLLKNVCKSQMVWSFCHQNIMYMITYRPYGTRNKFVSSTSVLKSCCFFVATLSLIVPHSSRIWKITSFHTLRIAAKMIIFHHYFLQNPSYPIFTADYTCKISCLCVWATPDEGVQVNWIWISTHNCALDTGEWWAFSVYFLPRTDPSKRSLVRPHKGSTCKHCGKRKIFTQVWNRTLDVQPVTSRSAELF